MYAPVWSNGNIHPLVSQHPGQVFGIPFSDRGPMRRALADDERSVLGYVPHELEGAGRFGKLVCGVGVEFVVGCYQVVGGGRYGCGLGHCSLYLYVNDCSSKVVMNDVKHVNEIIWLSLYYLLCSSVTCFIKSKMQRFSTVIYE